MENFFDWMSKPVPKEDVFLWFSINNIIVEKSDLFFDFCISLFNLVNSTYLGEESQSYETKITLNQDEKKKHFQWCWLKTLDNFKKENIIFSSEGEHYDYFLELFMEIYYKQSSHDIRNSLEKFIRELFDKEKPFSKSDLELFTEIYKVLDKNIIR